MKAGPERMGRNRDFRHRGLSFVEILIVVAILGILAAMVIPQYKNTSDTAKVNATLKDFGTFETAINVYAMKQNGVLPSSGSLLQAAISGYLPGGGANAVPGVGGQYNFYSWSATNSAAVSVSGSPNVGLLNQIDIDLDDGVASTGRVRITASNEVFYFVFGPVPANYP